jgi:SMC interacting uncharacterized protein involved in chromosome segregation
MTDPITKADGWTMASKVIATVLSAVLVAGLLGIVSQARANTAYENFQDTTSSQIELVLATQAQQQALQVTQVRVNTETEQRLQQLASVLDDVRDTFKEFRADSKDSTRDRITAPEVTSLLEAINNRIEIIDTRVANQINHMEQRLDARVTNTLNELAARQIKTDEHLRNLNEIISEVRERLVRLEERNQ